MFIFSKFQSQISTKINYDSYEKKNRSRKIQTLGSTVLWETRQPSFPTGTVGPRVLDFSVPTEHQ